MSTEVMGGAVAIGCLALIVMTRTKPGIQRAVGAFSVLALASGFAELWSVGAGEDFDLWSQLFGGMGGCLVMIAMECRTIVKMRSADRIGVDILPKRASGSLGGKRSGAEA